MIVELLMFMLFGFLLGAAIYVSIAGGFRLVPPEPEDGAELLADTTIRTGTSPATARSDRFRIGELMANGELSPEQLEATIVDEIERHLSQEEQAIEAFVADPSADTLCRID